MKGKPGSFTTFKATGLKYLNLAHNNLYDDVNSIPWASLTKLKMVELQYNYLDGELVEADWETLTELEYVNFSYNQLTGSVPIMTAAQ